MTEVKCYRWYVTYMTDGGAVGSIYISSNKDWFEIKRSRTYIEKEHTDGVTVIILSWVLLTEEQYAERLNSD